MPSSQEQRTQHAALELQAPELKAAYKVFTVGDVDLQYHFQREMLEDIDVSEVASHKKP